MTIKPKSDSEEEYKEWIKEYNNVYALGSWLVNEGHVKDTIDLLYYFEKPWKYYQSWLEMHGFA